VLVGGVQLSCGVGLNLRPCLLCAAGHCVARCSYASEWGATLSTKLPPTVEDQIAAKQRELEECVSYTHWAGRVGEHHGHQRL